MMLTEEVIHFVVNVLKIPKPLEKKRENPHGFLNQLISFFYETIPFQNMSHVVETGRPPLTNSRGDQKECSVGCGGTLLHAQHIHEVPTSSIRL